MFVVNGDSPAKIAARPDRQADRLGHAGVGTDLARRATSPTASASTARRISSRIYLEQAGDGPTMVARRTGRGAVGRRHRLAGLHRGDAGRRPLHRPHRRRGRAHPRQAQLPQADHRAGRRLSGTERAGEFGRLLELHPGAADARRRRRLSAGHARCTTATPRWSSGSTRAARPRRRTRSPPRRARRRSIRACSAICARSACCAEAPAPGLGLLERRAT